MPHLFCQRNAACRTFTICTDKYTAVLDPVTDEHDTQNEQTCHCVQENIGGLIGLHTKHRF
ncbi:hypothetical protein MKMG_01707 [Methanogenium sp. MK-MG]|nr:hypothetical protein MKMG_01707 [Methanogenium sp. MK-MG]